MFKSLSKNAAILALGGGLAFLGLTAWNWYHPPGRATLARQVQSPYDAESARMARNIDKAVIPVPEGIEALRPTQRQIDRIEDKLDSPLPSGEGITLLNMAKIERLPYGATGLVYLERQPEGHQKAVLRIYPSKPPFFEFTPERSLGAYYGLGFGQLGGRVWNIEFEQHLFRLGPAEFSARAGVLSSPLATDGYVMVGARATF